jgi:hypothetical protein
MDEPGAEADTAKFFAFDSGRTNRRCFPPGQPLTLARFPFYKGP